MKILKKLGVPAIALAGMLTLFTSSPAKAKVRGGVEVGPVYGYTYVGHHHYHHWHRYHRYYWR
jgi:hypothetical protein